MSVLGETITFPGSARPRSKQMSTVNHFQGLLTFISIHTEAVQLAQITISPDCTMIIRSDYPVNPINWTLRLFAEQQLALKQKTQ